MPNTINIISVLIEQHHNLQKNLGNIANLSNNKELDNKFIDQLLKRFDRELLRHIDFENNAFYVELLKKMKERGQDTAKTEKFIAEMDEIAKVIKEFLGKYNDPARIKAHADDFRKELDNIVLILNLRIESEEAGVFVYWDTFNYE